MSSPAGRIRPERTQAQRSETTTRALVDAARALFASKGYGATSLDDVAAAAGVTKGALYHHFDGKQGLFRAVVEREEQQLSVQLAEAFKKERDALRGLHAGCRTLLDAAQDPGFQRIRMLDAPSVLGWEAMRDIERRYSLKLVSEALAIGIQQGAIAARPIDPLAHVLVGAMCEGAMLVASAEDQRATARQVLAEVKTIVDSLAASPPRRRGERA